MIASVYDRQRLWYLASMIASSPCTYGHHGAFCPVHHCGNCIGCHDAFRHAWCMQGLHAMSMHGSLTEDLKNTDLSQLDNSQDIALMSMVPGQQRMSHEQLGPAMNPRYEYMLPRGLGLAVNGSTEGNETASEIMLHTPSKSSGGNGSTGTFRVPSDFGFMPQHHSLEVQGWTGVRSSLSEACMNDCCQAGALLPGEGRIRPHECLLSVFMHPLTSPPSQPQPYDVDRGWRLSQLSTST